MYVYFVGIFYTFLSHAHVQDVDGATLTKPKSMTSSNVTKSASSLSSTNKSNKNDGVVHREHKMKKSGSTSNNVIDPKKRLMVEEAKGKVRR